MDIELTVDAMRLVDHLDHIVLFTGDGDFRALVAAMQLKGRRVSIVSTLQTQPPMVADELRRQADQFVDLAELEDKICRDPATRPVRAPRGDEVRAPVGATDRAPCPRGRNARAIPTTRRRVTDADSIGLSRLFSAPT